MIYYFITAAVLASIYFLFLLLESAYFTVNHYSVLNIDSSNESRFLLIKKLVDNKRKVIVSIKFWSQITGFVSAILFCTALDMLLDRYGFAENLSVVLSIVITFLVIILFGQGIPQILGNIYYKNIVYRSAPLVNILLLISKHMLFGFKLIKCILEKFNISGKNYHSIEEIRLIAEESKNYGLIDDFGFKMISKASLFKDLTASEIMIPKSNATCIKENDNLETILNVYEEYGFSKLPVLNEGSDVIGFFNCKDILRDKDRINKLENIKEFIKTAVFVPETISVGKVLSKMREEQTEIILVSDEYGTFSGLITIKDIVERIFGIINDDYDFNQKRLINKVKSKSEAEILGTTSLKDIRNIVKIPIPNNYISEYKTLNAFLVFLKGSFLNKGDKIVYLDFEFEVENVTGHLAEKVFVKNLNKNEK